jgi:hypothetical protein
MSEREKPNGRLATPDDNHDQEPPERCGICGFKRIHVYPAEEGEAMRAVCLHCGARYHATFGWIDPQDP